jgi:hypothetical protein
VNEEQEKSLCNPTFFGPREPMTEPKVSLSTDGEMTMAFLSASTALAFFSVGIRSPGMRSTAGLLWKLAAAKLTEMMGLQRALKHLAGRCFGPRQTVCLPITLLVAARG